jgi:hypothetical protein
LVQTAIRTETASLTEVMRFSDTPVRTRGQRNAEEQDDGSVQLVGLLNWLNFAYDLSSALEYSLTGRRTEAAGALGKAKHLAVDSIGGDSLELLKCAQRLCNYVSGRWRPTKKIWQYAAASAIGAGAVTSAVPEMRERVPGASAGRAQAFGLVERAQDVQQQQLVLRHTWPEWFAMRDAGAAIILDH